MIWYWVEAIAKETATCIRKKHASFREKQTKLPTSLIHWEIVTLWLLSFSNIKSGQLEEKHFEFLLPGIPMAEHVLPGTAKTLISCLGMQGICHVVHLPHRRAV